MNSWKQFTSGIFSFITSSYESLASSWVVIELSFINGVNMLFACVTANQWQQCVLGKPAVKINESGAELREFSLNPGRPTRSNLKRTDLLFPESNNVFLPIGLKKTINRSAFERKRNYLHSNFSPSFRQKSQIIWTGKHQVDTIMLKLRW